jgi:uncharacterized protein YegL
LGGDNPSVPVVRAPEGQIGAKRALHLIYIVDRSGSMAGRKIGTLNFAVRSTMTPLREAAGKNLNAEVLVRVLAFSSGAYWTVPNATPVDRFDWTDLDADGETQMGKALEMVADEMRALRGQRLLPPVLILVTDGRPTDDFAGGLRRLLEDPIGKRAVRIAIAIGDDCDKATLQKFINNPEIKPLQAETPEDLVNYIKWASLVVTQSVSQVGGAAPGGLPIPTPAPSASALGQSSVVWGP